jgi:cytohesin
VHPEACFDCTGVSRRFRRVCLEAVGALAGQRWAVRLAAQRGHVAALRALLDGGADVAADLGDAWAVPPLSPGTALHWAARNGRAEAVQLLLGAGGAVDTVDACGPTALHWAAQQGHAEVARLLLGAGSAVDAANANGWTALHSAADLGHAEVVQLLLGAGAEPQSSLAAVQRGHHEIAQLLRDAGAAD